MPLNKVNEKISTFDAKPSNPSSNYFQGQFKSSAPIDRDPLVTGYAFIKWLKVPGWVEKEFPEFIAMTEQNFRAISGINDVDMNTVEIQEGFSGSVNKFAGSAAMFEGFQLTHREYSGSPIRSAYTHWVAGIRDPVTNIATYPKAYPEFEYTAKNHTGELIYIMTRPDANNNNNAKAIEFACLFTMVMPTRIHMGHLNFQAGSNDSAPELEQQFTGVPHIGPAVNQIAIDWFKKTYEFMPMLDYQKP